MSFFRISFLAASVCAVCAVTSGCAQQQGFRAENLPEENQPIVLRTMGSLFFGGTLKTLENGVTFHGDHGYAQYYVPQNARNYPIIMWHGIGQSGKTFESTADGREGYQSIFTRWDYPVYIMDQPRRGRAGRTLAGAGKAASPTALYESAAWDAFRMGLWIPPAKPQAFSHLQQPLDGYAVDQFFRQQTPDTGAEMNIRELGEAAGKLLEAAGPSVLLTHSRSGMYGWETAMQKPDLVKAVVAYEPGRMVFPDDAVPGPIEGEKPNILAMTAPAVPSAEFQKLTKMPILIIYGDNIAKKPSENFNSEVWRGVSLRAQQFAKIVNERGGDARVVFLPDLGLRGNTHIPFADLNNRKVAEQLAAWLHEKGLDASDQPYRGPGREQMPLTIPLDSKRTEAFGVSGS